MISKKTVRILVFFAFILLVVSGFTPSLNTSVKEVRAQEEASVPKAQIAIVPSNITLGQEGQPLPTPMVTLNVTITNVTNLFAWGIKVYFDSSVLYFANKTGAIFSTEKRPDGTVVANDTANIFYNKSVYPLSAVVKKDQWTDNYYVYFGATLLAPETGVNGSGVLCQLNFIGVGSGHTYLNFSLPYGKDTTLLNITETGTTEIPIPADVFNADVYVLGNGISLTLSPDTLTVKESVNITGQIFPRQQTSLTISFAPNETSPSWQTIATVTSDANGQFSYIWETSQAGDFLVKVSGGGYESQWKNVRVTGESTGGGVSDWLIYTPVGIAVVGVGAFFVWDRRRRHSNRLILP